MSKYRKVRHIGYKTWKDYVIEAIIMFFIIMIGLFGVLFFMAVGNTAGSAKTLDVEFMWQSIAGMGINIAIVCFLNHLYGGEEAWNRPTYKKYIKRLRKIAGKE